MRRLATIFMTAWMILTIPLQVMAQITAPSPPNLYAQAAVLMDADTGQVLWGKNMNQKMYPASLTKVITCLIAMEKGNPADVVTMTDEGIFSVPRGTTHAALTTGEQLTLEQLEYAMMVESANDAANGIAIHIAGSIDAFAAMMNEKAAEIGATGTHFTNANGLPESNHYTTAYDLGLFTVEAMKFPEFRTLAGTKYYEIPPTNLQKDTRRFSNRQYMFCLNDTYKGAFAGKTGWTEEAGKTLITIAERNGVTLIAVVLKAAGTVDAEFKDSTALLDYGFKHFKKVPLPTGKIPAQEVSVAGAGGIMETGTLKLDQRIEVLLPDGVNIADIEAKINAADPKNAAVTLTAPAYAEPWMSTQMGTYPMTLELPEVPVVAVADQGVLDLFEKVKPILLTTLKWFGIVVAVLIAVVVSIRQLLLMQHRKRMRLRARKRAATAARRTTPSTQRRPASVVDVTQDRSHKNKITVIGRDDL